MKIDPQNPIKAQGTTTKAVAATTTDAKQPAGKPTLVAGTIIKGSVLEITSDGKTLLDLGGRTVTAQTTVPLKPGTELLLEVKKGGTLPWLTPAGKKGVAQEIVRLLFTEGADLTKAANLLASGGNQSAPPSLPASLLAALANFSQEVGDKATGSQADPNKLTQLLALLRPTGKQPAPSPSLSQQLTETVERLAPHLGHDQSPVSELKVMAKFLDAHQQLNANQPGTPPNYLLFPCFFSGNAGWGEWMLQMEAGDKGQEEKETCSIDFFLQMSRLGDMHLKVNIQGEGLRGDFFVGEKSARSHLTEALPQLTTILEGHGYQPVSLAVHQSTENMLHTFKKKLEEKTNLRPFALVDVTA